MRMQLSAAKYVLVRRLQPATLEQAEVVVVTDSVFQGIPVRSCSPGSPAERAGVKQGDVVLFANGERIENMEQYVSARARRSDRLELTVLRGNRMLEFVVQLTAAAQDQQPPSALRDQNGS